MTASEGAARAPGLASAISGAEEALRTGRRDEARGLLEAALDVAERDGDAAAVTELLRRLGNLACNAGRTDEGVAILARAREVARAAGDRAREGHALMNLATARSGPADMTAAFTMLDEALELARAGGDRTLEAHVRYNTATLLTSVGAFERARELVEAALAAYRDAGHHAGEAYCLTTLGGIANSVGDPGRAGELLRQAVTIRRSLDDPRSLALSLANLGRSLHRHDQVEEGRRALEESVALLDLAADAWTGAKVLTFLADACVEAGDLDAADAAIARSLSLQSEGRDPDLAALALHSRTLVALARGDLEGALAEARASVAAVESVRRSLERSEDRRGYMAMGRACYESLVEASMALAGSDPSLAGAALEASDRSKARSLLDLLGGRERRERDAPAPLRERARVIDARLEELMERRFRMLAAGDASGEERASRREMELLATELDLVELRMEESAEPPSSLAAARPLTLPEIQAELDPDTLLVGFAIGESRSFAHAVSRDGMRHAELPGRRRLAALVAAAIAAASSRQGDAGGPLHELSQALLAPLGPLDARLLVLVPDGPLHAAPFAALPLGGSALVDRHEIVLLPSAAALPVLRRRHAGRAPRPPHLGIVADPVLHADDDRLPPAARGRARAVPAPGGDVALGRLPFTAREAAAIAGKLPAGRVTLVTGFDATVGAFRELAGRCDVLHVATHGFQDGARPDLSGVVLGLVGAGGEPVRGFLSTREAAGLTVAADLVVLSGCQTAVGREVAGEGIVGLPHAFLAAGASRVVASLWRVDDVATAELMTLFYDDLLAGDSPALALARAQRTMGARRRFRAPYFWAGFTLVGDWRP